MRTWHIKLILVLASVLLFSPVAALALQVTAEQPQQKTAPAGPRRIRVEGRVMQAKLIHQVAPKYPKEAKKQHIQGTVRAEIVVGRDGKVIATNALSGDPLLAKAAIKALQKRRYQPTLLNGQPVEVETEVDVKFYFPGGNR